MAHWSLSRDKRINMQLNTKNKCLVFSCKLSLIRAIGDEGALIETSTLERLLVTLFPGFCVSRLGKNFKRLISSVAPPVAAVLSS